MDGECEPHLCESEWSKGYTEATRISVSLGMTWARLGGFR